MGRKAVKSPLTAAVGLAAFALYFLGVNAVALLFAGGLTVMIGENLRRVGKGGGTGSLMLLAGSGPPLLAAVPFSLWVLFLNFLKIGAVLYGRGYVLLAFLRADFVVRLGWLTDRQLLNAVAIGQVTPGPVFTTATFVGFLLGGMPGALWATLGIFLPSFLFVAVIYPLVPRLRNSALAAGLLDGVNVASLGPDAAPDAVRCRTQEIIPPGRPPGAQRSPRKIFFGTRELFPAEGIRTV